MFRIISTNSIINDLIIKLSDAEIMLIIASANKSDEK